MPPTRPKIEAYQLEPIEAATLSAHLFGNFLAETWLRSPRNGHWKAVNTVTITYYGHVASVCCCRSAFRGLCRCMKSTYPGTRPLAAPSASCANPYITPIASPLFAVLAAVVMGNRSVMVSFSKRVSKEVRREHTPYAKCPGHRQARNDGVEEVFRPSVAIEHILNIEEADRPEADLSSHL